MKYSNELKLLNEQHGQPLPRMVRWLANTNAEELHVDNLWFT